jgi:hypothetical protein
MNRVVALVVLWVVSLYPGVGHAQSSNRTPALIVKVPFEFLVGNRTFPSGTYKFQSLLNPVAGKDLIDVLTVRSVESRLYQAIVTEVLGNGTEQAETGIYAHRRSRLSS